MALRDMVQKLRVPATAVLQRASSPRVSPAPGSRFISQHTSQNGEAMGAARGARGVRFKDPCKVDKSELSDFEKASIALDNLPKVCAMSAALGVFLATITSAYVFGAFDRSRRKYSA